jgi:hypothetical protein
MRIFAHIQNILSFHYIITYTFAYATMPHTIKQYYRTHTYRRILLTGLARSMDISVRVYGGESNEDCCENDKEHSELVGHHLLDRLLDAM